MTAMTTDDSGTHIPDSLTSGDFVHVRFSTLLDERIREGKVTDIFDHDGERAVRFQFSGTCNGHSRYTVAESDIHSLRVTTDERFRRKARRILQNECSAWSSLW